MDEWERRYDERNLGIEGLMGADALRRKARDRYTSMRKMAEKIQNNRQLSPEEKDRRLAGYMPFLNMSEDEYIASQIAMFDEQNQYRYDRIRAGIDQATYAGM